MEPTIPMQEVICPVCYSELPEYHKRVMKNVNGCAKLNPAAYQDCVNALGALMDAYIVAVQPDKRDPYLVGAKEALTLATQDGRA